MRANLPRQVSRSSRCDLAVATGMMHVLAGHIPRGQRPYSIGMPRPAFSSRPRIRSYTVRGLAASRQNLRVGSTWRRAWWLGFMAAAGLSGFLLSGCASQAKAPPPRGGEGHTPSAAQPISMALLGDWNDIDAALAVGLERGQSAVIATERSSRVVRFNLEAITGRSGVITFTRQSDASGRGAPSEMIEISAQIEGAQGPTLARRLVDATAARLSQLQGVLTAPINASDLAPEPVHEVR